MSEIYILSGRSSSNSSCDQVFIVTGGYGGVGFELCKILYAHNATVYIAGRSSSKAEKALETIKKESPNSNGRVEFLSLDLSDLSSIKPAVESFQAQQQRLDVLVNNAGVSPISMNIISYFSLRSFLHR